MYNVERWFRSNGIDEDVAVDTNGMFRIENGIFVLIKHGCISVGEPLEMKPRFEFMIGRKWDEPVQQYL